MTSEGLPYLPGYGGYAKLPLARYLPPLPRGMVQMWLQQNVPLDSYVIDPFGSTPALALEAARAGYRVLVAGNNPVIRFMIEVLASAPQEAEFQAAIAALGTVRRGEERLEKHLQSLYLTDCESCSKKIPVRHFLWHKGEQEPRFRYYHCQYCDDEGEYPLRAADIERLAVPGSNHLLRARAVQRSRLSEEGLQKSAQEALDVYQNRSLYFLFMLLNKLDGLIIDTRTRQLLTALLLSVCDEATTLWPWPAGRSRPKQIVSPPQFREKNLWLALEGAIQHWSDGLTVIPISIWPEIPAIEGSITIFPGKLKDLIPELGSVGKCVPLMVIPRPNQAFWTFSAIWSGWFWGQGAMRSMKGALSRRRYDWQWHANALYSVHKAVLSCMDTEDQMFSIMPEITTGYLFSTLAAASGTGLVLKGMTIREDQDLAQFVWMSDRSNITPIRPRGKNKALVQSVVEQSAIELFSLIREPASYLMLYSSILKNLAKEGVFPAGPSRERMEYLEWLQINSQACISDSNALKRYTVRGQTNESSDWWLSHRPGGDTVPQSDRIELELLDLLRKQPGCRQQDLEAHIFRMFPGLATPPSAFLQACLESYAEQTVTVPVEWRLYPHEASNLRVEDVREIKSLITRLGTDLGYAVSGNEPVTWQERGEIVYQFHVIATAAIGNAVLDHSREAEVSSLFAPARERGNIFVIPGGRARLLAYKIERDPHLAELLRSSFQVVKFRHIRRLANRSDLTRTIWEEILESDPVQVEDVIQMDIFSKE